MTDYYSKILQVKESIKRVERDKQKLIDSIDSVIHSLSVFVSMDIDISDKIDSVRKSLDLDIPYAINEFQEARKEQIVRYDFMIEVLNKQLIQLREKNTVCERCGGSGSVNKPRPTAECEREKMCCPDCKGHGIIYK